MPTVRTITNSRVTRVDALSSVVASVFTRRVVKDSQVNNVIKVNILSKIVNNRIGAGGGALDTSRFKFFQIPTPSPDGATTVFTTDAYTANTLTVYRDQLALQGGGVDFTETTPGSGIFTLISAPDSDEVVWCNFITAS